MKLSATPAAMEPSEGRPVVKPAEAHPDSKNESVIPMTFTPDQVPGESGPAAVNLSGAIWGYPQEALAAGHNWTHAVQPSTDLPELMYSSACDSGPGVVQQSTASVMVHNES
jgi:hypothetical protein